MITGPMGGSAREDTILFYQIALQYGIMAVSESPCAWASPAPGLHIFESFATLLEDAKVQIF